MSITADEEGAGKLFSGIKRYLIVMRCRLFLDVLHKVVERFQFTRGKRHRSPVCAVVGKTVSSRT